MTADDLLAIAAYCVRRQTASLSLQVADIEDLRQDVLVAMLDALRRHKPERSPLSAFMFMVARAATGSATGRLLQLRKRARQLTPADDRPEDHVWGLDDRDEVAYLMGDLPPTQREAVEACFFRHMGSREHSLSRGRHPAASSNAMWHAANRMRRKAKTMKGATCDEAA